MIAKRVGCRLSVVLAALLLPHLIHAAPPVSDRNPLIEVTGSTIIAFFPPLSDADSKNPDTNEVLSDFQLYAGQVQESLKHRGIRFEQVSARSFRVKDASGVHSFVSRRGVPGYYFVEPGKKPYVQYGVMTDIDILDRAGKYFSTR
jgi:hypothetical protein